MEGNRDHKGYGGKGQENGQLSTGDSEWEGLHREISKGLSDEGHFYAVGDLTVVTEVPWETP